MMNNKIETLKKELELLILNGHALTSSNVIKKACQLENILTGNIQSVAS